MIYNFNLGLGWASSGVEYAQAYRARIFRDMQEPARFIFTDMFPQENIEHLARNIGFKDDEVIWLYTFFTDFPVEPVTYTRHMLEDTFPVREFQFTRKGKKGRYIFSGQNNFYTVYFVDDTSDLVHRVEYVSGGCLIRKDYFTSARIYTEYYAPKDGRAKLYLRRFFNRDQTTAYEEIIDGESVLYRFPDQILYSKESLVGYLVRRLHLTRSDLILIDRTTGIGQAILENAGEARVGVIVHADHYSASYTDSQYILWNNYYEYPFDMYRHISFFVNSTEEQSRLMRRQFQKYVGEVPGICTVPVGFLDRLRRPEGRRKPFSVITASRLAPEKHVDWVVNACIQARKVIPELTLEIYGVGAEYERLVGLIREADAGSYIHLMGQHDLTECYRDRELYLSGSTSEGFGLSLMEAVGSGLAMVGFDVPYGNPTFIDDAENGYRIRFDESIKEDKPERLLAEKVVEYFQQPETVREKFHERSYAIASAYLEKAVEQKWRKVIEEAGESSC
ncbi:MAG: accessory Sec system glycosyltransferase GtfA [Lachnospira sp.]|nr:accessory Sec system glycosyltransferase GtfA [Lachnospira sp.]